MSGSVVVRSKAEVGLSWNVGLFWPESGQAQAGEGCSEAEAGGRAWMWPPGSTGSQTKDLNHQLLPLEPSPASQVPKTEGADQSPPEAPGLDRPAPSHSAPWLLVPVAHPGNLLAELLLWGEAALARVTLRMQGRQWAGRRGRTPAQTRTQHLPHPQHWAPLT